MNKKKKQQCEDAFITDILWTEIFRCFFFLYIFIFKMEEQYIFVDSYIIYYALEKILGTLMNLASLLAKKLWHHLYYKLLWQHFISQVENDTHFRCSRYKPMFLINSWSKMAILNTVSSWSWVSKSAFVNKFIIYFHQYLFLFSWIPCKI